MKIIVIVFMLTVITGCTQVSTIDPTIGTHGSETHNVKSKLSDAYVVALDAALVKGSADAEKKHLWKTGKAYARILCSDVFRIIALTQAKRKNARSQTNIVGGLVTGALGLTGSPVSHVGASGLVFSSVDSSFDAYDSAFSITPDIEVVESLVRASQDKMAESFDSATFSTGADVIVALNEYVSPCTFTGMKSLLEKSAAIGTNQIKDGTSVTPLLIEK